MRKVIRFMCFTDDLRIKIKIRWKTLMTFILFGTMALSLYGCGKQEPEGFHKFADIKSEESDLVADIKSEETDTTADIKSEETDAADTEQEENNANVDGDIKPGTEPDTAGNFSFADLKNYEFCFSSGAGAWSTILNIHADGSFSGEYHDSDMGVTGDNYPNGTMYRCDFTGRFTQPEKINDYTYAMEISELNYAMEPGKEEIKDEMLYCYTEAHGLQNAEKILIYLPGMPLTELSEELRIWLNHYDLSEPEDPVLTSYALNNEKEQFGFSSYNLIEQIKEILSYTESGAASLENSIRQDPLTQMEYNEKSKELYDLWDSTLNMVWDVLKKTKDAEAMGTITAEERSWIELKEQAVSEAGAANEGGTMQAMVENLKAAELTKARVYELMGLL